MRLVTAPPGDTRLEAFLGRRAASRARKSSVVPALLAVLLLSPLVAGSGGGARVSPLASSAAGASDAASSGRPEGRAAVRLDPLAARRTVADLESSLRDRPGSLALHVELMQALYLLGHFATAEDPQRREIFERQLEVSRSALDLVAESAGCGDLDALSRLPAARRIACLRPVEGAPAAHFWAAISWGLWGMSHSRLAAARRGVARRIREHAEALIELDESYADGGGPRLLGRLHTAAPRIPLVTGWIDRREGIELLRSANAISTADPRNPLFLAEALLRFEPGRRDEAIGLLRGLVRRRPRSEHELDDLETLETACRLLTEAEGGDACRPVTAAGASDRGRGVGERGARP